jgi:hypothetical protein
MVYRPAWQEALAATACAVLLWAPSAGAAWEEPVGGTSPINEADASAEQISMAVEGGVPYVARQERSASGADLRVSVLDSAGADWAPVGGAANTTTATTENAELALVGGVPHVAYWEGPFVDVEVKRYDATTGSWIQLGGAVNHFPTVSTVFMAIAAFEDEPWVAVSDGELLRVARYDDALAAWVQVGTPLNADPADRAREVDIAVVGGRPWVAWVEEDAADSTDREVRVARLNDAADGWEEVVGGASPVNASATGVARQVRLAAVGDIPYVAWTELDGAGEHQVRVSTLNTAGDDWEEPVGGASPIGVAPGPAAGRAQRFVSLAPVGAEPYVGFVDETGVPHVKRLVDGGGWEEIGAGSAPIAGFARDIELVEIGGVPYVGYEDAAGQARVERIEPDFIAAGEAVTPTLATLAVEVRTYGVAYPMVFFFDEGPTPTTQVGTEQVRSGNADSVVAQLKLPGLAPSTLYSWYGAATDGTRVFAPGSVRTFTTPAEPSPPTSPSPPSPEPQPQPQPESAITAEETSGEVFVKLPGSNRYVSLQGLRGIPLGSVVDAEEGRVRITSANHDGSAEFYAGIFKVLETKGPRPITEARLVEKLGPCPSGKRASASAATRRRLWGNGKGRFRTRGKYSSGAVRGTKWLVEDRCSGTLTRVRRGRVKVRDFVKDKDVVVRAGESYLAHP